MKSWGAVVVLALISGCATAPYFRPQGPPPDDKVAEMGIGPFVEVARDKMGVGGAGWLHAQVIPDFELVMRGHGANFFNYDGTGAPGEDVQAGGAIGVRGRYRAFPTLLLGGELLGDYLIRTKGAQSGNVEHFISLIAGFPVAEQAFEGFWVYTNPSIGVALPLHDNPGVPFFGFQEVPIGIVWQPFDWMLLCAEGGYAVLPVNGGYAGVSVAFRL